jgi:hypothetical protein
MKIEIGRAKVEVEASMVENLELGTFLCLTDLGIKAEHRLNLQH